MYICESMCVPTYLCVCVFLYEHFNGLSVVLMELSARRTSNDVYSKIVHFFMATYRICELYMRYKLYVIPISFGILYEVKLCTDSIGKVPTSMEIYWRCKWSQRDNLLNRIKILLYYCCQYYVNTEIYMKKEFHANKW